MRYFLVVCQEKNITKAAKQLHISQPSLSRQLKELEEELGTTLFNRGHRHITLTEEGYFLRDRAQEIIDLTDNTINTLTSKAAISGTLRIGAGQSQALEGVMKIISEIISTYPDVQIELEDANADTVEKRINNGSLDFGIVMGERPLDKFNSFLLPAKNRFCAVFNRRLPLAGLQEIRPIDLLGYPLMISSQSFVSDKFERWFGVLKNQMHHVVSSNLPYNASLISKDSRLVEITYPGLVNTGAQSELVMRPLVPEITDANTLIWKRDLQQSNLGRLFLEKVRQLS